MTSHQGPPIPLAGPYQPASLIGEASVLFKSHLQKHHNQPPGQVSEPNPKRRKTDAKSYELRPETIDNPSFMLLTGNSTSAASLNGHESALTDKSSKLLTTKQPTLLPVRRPYRLKTGKSNQQGTNLAIERAAMKHEVQTKAYVPEPPHSAPQYRAAGSCPPELSNRASGLLSSIEAADFFPWSGHHLEDVLNESTTRNGFYDKLAASQNEFLTAKSSILSSLKNKSGLETLSNLFSSTLSQREGHGIITASSTFKPPPRVTLTDNKKELWLKDLADPEISLRRLSRTIPHGIRGRVLLDHCLNKSIPISRAIWLVKCVGANEIRACKRKGTSGNFTVGGVEKWIQDWTANVEQFLESIIAKCGSENWKTSMNYGLRLLSHIHVEQLLDRDQYYTWLINRLATSKLDNLPIWLLIAKTYKRDLVRCREYGIHLASALLSQLNQARESANKLPYNPLFQELLKECRILLADSPDCFLSPRCWEANKQLIHDFVVSGNKFLQGHFEDLTQRVQKFENHSFERCETASRSAEQNIIAALDSLVDAPDYPKIASMCLMFAESGDELVKICLQWATSTFRCGRYRIYAAVRLLRIWSKHSVDLQNPVLEFLSRGEKIPNIDWPDFYSVCAELVSSRHLSTGRYCQWLMARGALSKYRDRSSADIFDVQLLFEIPLHGLPDHIVNLRRSLLSSMGVVVEREEADIVTMQVQIAKQLPAIFLQNVPPQDSVTDQVQPHTVGRTQKAAIARWIQQSISSYAKAFEKQQKQDPVQKPHFGLSEEGFKILRRIFEDLEEFPIFGDILCALVATAGTGALFEVITCTVNRHFNIFDSLGTAKHLFGQLFTQRKLVSPRETFHSSFTLALLDLGLCIPSAAPEVRTLRKDDALLNPKQSAAAPSPLSDHMFDAIHSDKVTFLEEMDQILTSGITMDDTTRASCFASITDRLQKSWDAVTPSSSCQYSGLLARLRVLDEKSFDRLAAQWLDTLVAHPARPSMSVLLPPLICHDVCTLGTVVNHAMRFCQSHSQEQAALVALETLELLSSDVVENTPSLGCRDYRLAHQRHTILQTHFESLVSLIHSCATAGELSDGSISHKLRRSFSSAPLKSFMRMLVSQVSIADKSLRVQHSSDVRSALREILSREWVLGLKTSTIQEKFRNLLDNISDLNGPVSQLSLEIIVNSPSESDQPMPDIFTDILLEKMSDATQSQVIAWSRLFASLHAKSCVFIHSRIVGAIVSQISIDQTEDRLNTEYLLEIATATSNDVPDAVTYPFIEQILEHLSDLGNSLGINNKKMDVKSRPEEIAEDILILLRLLTIYQATILDSKFSQPLLAQICVSLIYLYLRASNSSCTSLANYTCDVLAIISDALSRETRSHSVRALLGHQMLQDSRILFVLGDNNTPTDGDWLRLVSGVANTQDANNRHPYSIRYWEMMQDATAAVTENDACVSLTLFATKKSVL